MSALLLAMAAAAANPSPEALRLGRQIAESGTLAALLPVIQQKETEELTADKSLTEADRRELRATAAQVYRIGYDRLMDATARAYAERMSITDLRAVAAFHRSRAGARYRNVTPEAIAATMQAVGKMDFKSDVRGAFCKKTGKLCSQ